MDDDEEEDEGETANGVGNLPEIENQTPGNAADGFDRVQVFKQLSFNNHRSITIFSSLELQALLVVEADCPNNSQVHWDLIVKVA